MRTAPFRPVAMVATTLVVGLVAACGTTVTGHPTASTTVAVRTVDPVFVRGTDGGTADRLAATVLTDLQGYWRQTYPRVFGRPWQDVAGGVYSVDSGDAAAKPPPCADRAAEVQGNAFYCPAADAIAWDRAALLPVLRERFGDAGVVLVLAHEMGHAVQHRAGLSIEELRDHPDRYPMILVETMADCYAGAVVRWVTDGHAPDLRMGPRDLDAALSTLVTFRDPVGTTASDMASHGDAFDRVGAFQDGYQRGPDLCAGMTVQNRRFTQQEVTEPGARTNGGNLPLDQLLAAMGPDLAGYFGGVVAGLGRRWAPPRVQPTGAEPGCGGDQGPAAFCPAQGAIDVDIAGAVPRLHRQIGDYAVGTLVASRFGLAALAAVGRPVDGEDAGRGAVCLAGAYTGTLLARRNGFALSPGDLDKAVELLLGYDFAARDVHGHPVPTGYQRVAAFRAGFQGGARSCGLG
ncbi:aminopeptidase [Gandjariella thermophila]|uniref:Aminopeptidase n=1 Tax=Gandjariella thermophila TaxID=1931992 RepID=A0A4D4J9Z3_9PSEU|nr:aminopeptidase [Gandjariella thermophila]